MSTPRQGSWWRWREDHDILIHDGEKREDSAAPVVEPEPAARAPAGPFARRRRLEVTRRELGTLDWAKKWLDKQLQHIAKLGELVLGVMDLTVKLVEYALTKNLQAGLYHEIKLFDFNYDKDIRGPICGFNLQDNILPPDNQAAPPFWGECRRCYAYSTVALLFEVEIVNNELLKVVALINGDLDFNMVMDELFVPSIGYVGEFSKLIKSIRTKDGLSVPLGFVNLNIGAYVPVTLGVDMWLSGAASFSVDVSATANIEAGYRYVKAATPQQQMVNKVHYSYGGKGVKMLRWAGREVGVRLSLLPVVQFQLSLGVGPLQGMAYIGGPNFGLEASVAAMVTASNATTAVVERTIGMEGTLGANMTLRLGSDKSKDLLGGKGEVVPKGIYSGSYPMGRDTVRFVAFTAPRSPRRLQLGLPDEEITAPDPAPPPPPGPPPVVGPPPEWTAVGTTYAGTLQRLRGEPEDGMVPPYLDLTAVVLAYTVLGNGGLLDAALTFSYGKAEPSMWSGDLGAFAAISQSAYTFSLYFDKVRAIPSSCNNLDPYINALMSTEKPLSSYPNITYRANTTTEAIKLPRMAGGFCEDGNKIRLFDTMKSISIVLDRVGQNPDPPTSTRRRALSENLSSEERRRKLGHMDRFPRILQQCAPPKPPTPSPTRLPTSRPPSNAPTQRPSTPPSNRPTLAPSMPPTQAPSTLPTQPPVTLAPSLNPTASTRAPTTPPPSNLPTRTITALPSPPPSAAASAYTAASTSLTSTDAAATPTSSAAAAPAFDASDQAALTNQPSLKPTTVRFA